MHEWFLNKLGGNHPHRSLRHCSSSFCVCACVRASGSTSTIHHVWSSSHGHPPPHEPWYGFPSRHRHVQPPPLELLPWKDRNRKRCENGG